MHSPLRRLPPFAGLVAFDAVLRHRSMTMAAAELGLTQSAISHRLRALETYFDMALLERLNPGLRPTPAGERLAASLAPLLAGLMGLQAKTAGRAGVRPFRVAMGSALLAWWLSPRLPALTAAFPELAIEIVTLDGGSGAAAPEADLTLQWLLRSALRPERGMLLFPDEIVFPVAAPSRVVQIDGTDWRRGLPLLAKGRPGEDSGPEWSWATWLETDEAPPARMRFRDIGGALQAAVEGTGVALARSLLVADALRDGRLRQLAGSPAPLPCSKVQIARWRDPGDGLAGRMATWLVEAARLSLEQGVDQAAYGGRPARDGDRDAFR